MRGIGTHFPTDGSWAVEPVTMAAGDRVAFRDDRFWWDVVAVSDHFVALTRQAAFKPRGELVYTVVDWRNGVRGPCNLIGQGYGEGTYTAAECEQMLGDFEGTGDLGWKLEVSHRNWLPIDIRTHEPAAGGES